MPKTSAYYCPMGHSRKQREPCEDPLYQDFLKAYKQFKADGNHLNILPAPPIIANLKSPSTTSIYITFLFLQEFYLTME